MKTTPSPLTESLARVLQNFSQISELDADAQTITNHVTARRLFRLGYLAKGRILVGGGERYHISQLGIQMLDIHRIRTQRKNRSRS